MASTLRRLFNLTIGGCLWHASCARRACRCRTCTFRVPATPRWSRRCHDQRGVAPVLEQIAAFVKATPGQ